MYALAPLHDNCSFICINRESADDLYQAQRVLKQQERDDELNEYRQSYHIGKRFVTRIFFYRTKWYSLVRYVRVTC